MPGKIGPNRNPYGPDRALAYNIALFFATIILGFLLAIVVEPGATDLLDFAANETSRQSAAQGQSYVRFAFSNLNLIVIGFGALQLIVAAVYEANVGGGFR